MFVLVAHNGNSFDVPMISRTLRREYMDLPVLLSCSVSLLDALLIAKLIGNGLDNSLDSLHKDFFGEGITNAHDAKADVKALDLPPCSLM